MRTYRMKSNDAGFFRDFCVLLRLAVRPSLYGPLCALGILVNRIPHGRECPHHPAALQSAVMFGVTALCYRSVSSVSVHGLLSALLCCFHIAVMFSHCGAVFTLLCYFHITVFFPQG